LNKLCPCAAVCGSKVQQDASSVLMRHSDRSAALKRSSTIDERDAQHGLRPEAHRRKARGHAVEAEAGQ